MTANDKNARPPSEPETAQADTAGAAPGMPAKGTEAESTTGATPDQGQGKGQAERTAAAGNDTVLSLEERKAQLQRERDEIIARNRELRNERLQARMAALEQLDEESDDLAPPGSAPGAAGQTVPPAAMAPPVPPPALPARPRRRHVGIMLSFVVLVILPVALSAWYIWNRAADRYASHTAFGVRTEEAASAFEILGSVAQISGSSGSDTEILYAFIRSQNLVARIDAALDLRGLWSKADPDVDPVFSYHPPGTIEDLTDYWNRMVKVYSDSGTGLIDITVQAFTPEDAQAISLMIYDESSRMINALSTTAREDATRYAREDLAEAEERLKAAREAVTRFRNLNQLVDPTSSAQAQMGILNSLQQQLATNLVELDILRQTTADSDPRVQQAERRITVIEDRIRAERNTLGIADSTGAGGSNVLADLLGEYERLVVELEFAEQSYTAALAAYDSSVADARRQSRYIAAHIPPTLAEAAKYPNRLWLIGIIGLFCLLSWAMLVLIGYAIRDRR